MDQTKLQSYETPQVEIVEVKVEQGFATSGAGNLNEFGNGGVA